MHTHHRLVVPRAGRVTVGLVVLAIAVVGCSGDDTSAPSEPAVTSTAETIAPTTEAVATAEGAVQQLEDVVADGEETELTGGRYTGEHLNGLVLSVPAGTNAFRSFMGPAYFFSDPAGGMGSAWVGQIAGAVPPERVGSPVPKDELDEVLTDVPEDLGPYFDAIPQLEVLDRGETAAYRWWDIQVQPDVGDTHGECGPPNRACISLWGEPTGEVTLNMFTDWVSRIVQPIGAPTILLWSTEESSIGPHAELVSTLAGGLAAP